MIEEATEIETTTLGDYLRSVRQNQGLDISAVADNTKISHKNLLAIEEDNYGVLPAEAFTRGFYRLYAKILSLNPEEILQRYDSEKTTRPKKITKSVYSNKNHGQEVSLMAERPSLVPFSSFGLIIFVLLFFGAFLCWYFSWNPASFLSHKLRNLQDNIDSIEQVQIPIKKPPFTLLTSHASLADGSAPLITEQSECGERLLFMRRS